jgi:hypothetical protein
MVKEHGKIEEPNIRHFVYYVHNPKEGDQGTWPSKGYDLTFHDDKVKIKKFRKRFHNFWASKHLNMNYPWINIALLII